MIFPENILKSPCRGRLVFAFKGQYSDSRHPNTANNNKDILSPITPLDAYSKVKMLDSKLHKDGKATGSNLKKLRVELEG